MSQQNGAQDYEYFSILKLKVVSKSGKIKNDEYKYLIENFKLTRILEMLAFAMKFYDPNFSHKLVDDF